MASCYAAYLVVKCLRGTFLLGRPFGWTMPGKKVEHGYRYGFNGMERDDELKGAHNSYDFGARIYDTRVGRWLAVDHASNIYPDLSPYNFCGNNPIRYVDVGGYLFVNPYKEHIEPVFELWHSADAAVCAAEATLETLKGKLEGTSERKERRALNKEIRGQEGKLRRLTRDEKRARQTYEFLQERSDRVDELIDEFSKVRPNDYEELNNWKANGGAVDVEIYVYVGGSNIRTFDKPDKGKGGSPGGQTIYGVGDAGVFRDGAYTPQLVPLLPPRSIVIGQMASVNSYTHMTVPSRGTGAAILLAYGHGEKHGSWSNELGDILYIKRQLEEISINLPPKPVDNPGELYPPPSESDYWTSEARAFSDEYEKSYKEDRDKK